MSRNTFVDLVLALARLPRAFAWRAEERKHRQLMRSAPAYALASMPENTFGKLVGTVRPHQQRLLEAPLSGRLCVYYEVTIDAMSDGNMLRELATEQEAITFVLADGEAEAIIDPAHASMSTGIDHVTDATLTPTDERERAVLRRHTLAGASIAQATGLRFREAIVAANERIAVFGAGIRELDRDAAPGTGEGMYRDRAMPTRLRLTGTSRFPLFISDDPRVL